MIHRDTEELAENKLVLLYILSEAGMPLSKNQVTQVVLENSLMNYFSMQQFLLEMVQKGLAVCYEHMGRHYYRIHSRGLEVLNLFSGRIPGALKKALKEYLAQKGALLKKENSIQSSCQVEGPDSYSVCLKLVREDSVLFELKVLTSSEKDARKLCANWNSGAGDLYRGVIKLLSQEEAD